MKSQYSRLIFLSKCSISWIGLIYNRLRTIKVAWSNCGLLILSQHNICNWNQMQNLGQSFNSKIKLFNLPSILSLLSFTSFTSWPVAMTWSISHETAWNAIILNKGSTIKVICLIGLESGRRQNFKYF